MFFSLAAVLLAATPAAAGCPPETRGIAYVLGTQAMQQGDADALLDLAELGEACPADPYVQYMSAMALVAAAGTVPATSDERAILVPLAMLAHARSGGGWLDTIQVTLPDGTAAQVTGDSSHELSKALALLVVDTERATRVDVVTPALAETPEYCPTWWILPELGKSFGAGGATPGGWALANRAVDCNPKIRDAKGFRAKAALLAAPHVADLPSRLALLKRAEEDMRAYLGDKPWDSWWSTTDTAALREALIEAAPAPPEDSWFSAEWVGKPETRRALAKALDLAWTGDIGVEGSRAYRELLLNLQIHRIPKSADPAAARTMVCDAIADHAKRRVRRPETKEIADPPAWMSKFMTCPEPPK